MDISIPEDADLRAAVRHAEHVTSMWEQRKFQAEVKFHNYTALQCDYAIKDCHDTLDSGQYPYDSPYAQKLWAEIDAARERKAKLQKQSDRSPREARTGSV